jgi:hypothetical protein
MTTTVTGITLCTCRHIHSVHNADADCTRCRCGRFQRSARTSSSHYQRGQATTRKRVVRLEGGDRILVRFTDDGQLTLAPSKAGALIAGLTAPPMYGRGGWRITTNLGDLPPLSGACAAHVLTGAPSW